MRGDRKEKRSTFNGCKAGKRSACSALRQLRRRQIVNLVDSFLLAAFPDQD